jgi:hypothetical protein
MDARLQFLRLTKLVGVLASEPDELVEERTGGTLGQQVTSIHEKLTTTLKLTRHNTQLPLLHSTGSET